MPPTARLPGLIATRLLSPDRIRLVLRNGDAVAGAVMDPPAPWSPGAGPHTS